MPLFTAFYFVIALSLEADWGLPNHELVKLWALGSLLVGLAALPAGWRVLREKTAGNVRYALVTPESGNGDSEE